MRVTLEYYHSMFRLVAENGRSILLQSDWDFPKVASLFGYVPCHCRQTDGTIRCDHRTPAVMIPEAVVFLWEHVGDSVEDPGYF